MDAEFIGIWSLVKRNCPPGYSGAGIAMNTKERPLNPKLPFFKQFNAGGPNSMRAWGLRLLGPGSTLKYRDEAPLRFGDFQFETNAEYRFPLVQNCGVPSNGAVFTDIGNVWFLRRTLIFRMGNYS